MSDEIIEALHQRVNKMEADLRTSEENLSQAIKELAKSVNKMATNFDSFLNIAGNAIPLKVVGWMFFIVVLATGALKGLDKLTDKIPPGIFN